MGSAKGNPQCLRVARGTSSYGSLGQTPGQFLAAKSFRSVGALVLNPNSVTAFKRFANGRRSSSKTINSRLQYPAAPLHSIGTSLAKVRYRDSASIRGEAEWRCAKTGTHILTRNTAPRPCRRSCVVTLENSPSKVAAADQPFSHFISAEAVTSAASCACAAPLTTKDAPAASGTSHRCRGRC